jgi:hypothetical protein
MRIQAKQNNCIFKFSLDTFRAGLMVRLHELIISSTHWPLQVNLS